MSEKNPEWSGSKTGRVGVKCPKCILAVKFLVGFADELAMNVDTLGTSAKALNLSSSWLSVVSYVGIAGKI